MEVETNFTYHTNEACVRISEDMCWELFAEDESVNLFMKFNRLYEMSDLG